MNEMMLILVCVFGAVAMIGFVLVKLLVGDGQDSKLRSRLTANSVADAQSQQQSKASVAPLMQRVGQAAAAPFMPKTREKQSSIRKNLAFAGIYSPNAVKVVTGFKLILLGGGILGGYAFGAASDQLLLGLSVGGLLGYMAPTMWLRMRIKGNQQALSYGLADGLDLMVVCVEAGLTIDAAMQRVGQELMIAHPAISREFAITYMETRVGLARADALKNLGTRTGNPPLQSLASMLTQADRFGTSIAGALRIHADTLRQQRQHAAEEMAAKASVKMSFPLVLFIFPATFIVLAGPTVIGLMNSGMM
ncbi:MAG TPA: type II secretion system F family protein [Tepidisphaeraceae bacterium]|nr:type II secretion system F family protein [Tepidisphaeraceae bacterium]